MGRRSQCNGTRITTAVRIPAELHERLQQEAAARDLSINYLVVRGIDLILDRLRPIEVTEQELRSTT